MMQQYLTIAAVNISTTTHSKMTHPMDELLKNSKIAETSDTNQYLLQNYEQSQSIPRLQQWEQQHQVPFLEHTPITQQHQQQHLSPLDYLHVPR